MRPWGYSSCVREKGTYAVLGRAADEVVEGTAPAEGLVTGSTCVSSHHEPLGYRQSLGASGKMRGSRTWSVLRRGRGMFSSSH